MEGAEYCAVKKMRVGLAEKSLVMKTCFQVAPEVEVCMFAVAVVGKQMVRVVSVAGHHCETCLFVGLVEESHDSVEQSLG